MDSFDDRTPHPSIRTIKVNRHFFWHINAKFKFNFRQPNNNNPEENQLDPMWSAREPCGDKGTIFFGG